MAVFAVLSAMALVVLDAGGVNVALPTLASALKVTPSGAVLVVTAYQAGLVIGLLPCGALGERFGQRRVFTLGVVLFALGAALSAASPSLPWLLSARLLQGLGGAAVMALGVALLRLIVPPHRLGAAIGWNALTVALTSAAAPSLAAALLPSVGWRGLFAADLPVAAVALAAAFALPKPTGSGRRLATTSLGLNAATAALVVAGAALAPVQPLQASALIAVGLACGAVLWRREAARDQSMVPVDLLRIRPVRLSAAASVCCFAGQGAGLVALPFLLEHDFRQSTAATGLFLTAWPLAVAATAPIAGALADRIGTARLCVAGGVLLSLGLASAAALPTAGDARWLIASVVLCGAGFGLFQSPNNRNLFLSTPAHRSGAAGGLQGGARILGQTAGAVLISLAFAHASGALAPRLGLAVGAGLALAGALVSSAREGREVRAETA